MASLIPRTYGTDTQVDTVATSRWLVTDPEFEHTSSLDTDPASEDVWSLDRDPESEEACSLDMDPASEDPCPLDMDPGSEVACCFIRLTTRSMKRSG